MAVPEKFRRLLENVAIIVENEPTLTQKRKLHIHENEMLFGLYEGVPKSARGSNYTGVLPDKITIFMNPILEEAGGDGGRVKEIVRDTVWHEIAHHFGFDEEEIRLAEKKKKIIK